jgi:hypothetical protein
MRAVWGLAVAIVFTIACSGAWSQHPTHKAPQIPTEEQPDSRLKSEDGRTGQAQEAAPAPPASPIISPDGANRESKADPQQGEQEGTEFWSPLAGYRFKITDTLLVVFTFLLFCATVALFIATRDLVKEAKETGAGQVEAAKAAAAATQESVRAYKASQRAVLSPKGFETPQIVDAETKKVMGIGFLLHWVNTGQTEARNCKLSIRTRQTSPDEPIPIFEVVRTDGQTSASIGAKGTAFTTTIALPIDRVVAVARGAVNYYVYVWASYDDIFGEVHEIQATFKVIYHKRIADLTEFLPEGTNPTFIFESVGSQNRST